MSVAFQGRRSGPSSPRTVWDSRLGNCVDAGIAGVIFVAPLFMGGRHPLGKLVFVAIVCATAIAWLLRQCVATEARWERSWTHWIIVGGVALILLQLVPLPQNFLRVLSPSMQEHVPLWTQGGDLRLGTWSQVSLYPDATCGGLVMFVSCAMLFIVVAQHTSKIADIERLLRWLAISITVMAVIGLVQLMAGNGKFLWTYEYPQTTADGVARGAFSNPNHFSHFLALGIGAVIYCLCRKEPTDNRSTLTGRCTSARFAGPAFVAICFAVLLSLSRGGTLACGIGTTICFVLLWRKSLLERRQAVSLFGAGLLLIIAFCAFGVESVENELQKLWPSDDANFSQQLARTHIWSANLRAIPEFAVLGSGVGTHRYVYHPWFDQHVSSEFSHAENGYLQVLLETGVPGLALLLTGIVAVLFFCVQTIRRSRSERVTACAIAVFCGLIVSALHSIVDFVWYIPACMSVAVILAACALRLYRLTDERVSSVKPHVFFKRPVWIAACTVVALTATGMIVDRVAPSMAATHWDSYRIGQFAAEHSSALEDPKWRRALTESSIRDLRLTVACDPNHVRAHGQLAQMLKHQFNSMQKTTRNPMALGDIRGAAFASQFDSRESLRKWLVVAVGENLTTLEQALHHTTRALRLCPVEGLAYLQLSELAFLLNAPDSTQDVLLQEASRLRPRESAILMHRAVRAVDAGEDETAIKLWQQSFENSDQKPLILSQLAPLLPPEALLSVFELDSDQLLQVMWIYKSREQMKNVQFVGQRYLEVAEPEARAGSGTKSAGIWQRISSVHRVLGNSESTLEALGRAARSAPSNFTLRRQYGLELLKHNQYQAAVTELEWCLRRQPSDRQLQEQLAKARRFAMAATDTNTAIR